MACLRTVVRKGFDIRIHTKHSEFGIFYEFDIVIRKDDGHICGGPWRYKDACCDTISWTIWNIPRNVSGMDWA